MEPKNSSRSLKNSYQWIYDFLALVTGLVVPFAFAPFHNFYLALLVPAAFYVLVSVGSPSRAFWRGFLFGLGMFGLGVSWVYVSIHRYGNAGPILAGSITVLFVLYLALFPAFLGWLLQRWFPKHTFAKCVLAFPAMWIFIDWLRGWLLSGFPWLYLGYSQLETPLQGYAPIFGVHGVSWMVLLSSAAFVYLVVADWRRKIISVAILAAVWLGGYLLSSQVWTGRPSETLSVAMIQGNIPQDLKWKPEQLSKTLELYWDLSRDHLQNDLIIWPEAAMPLPLPAGNDFLKAVSQRAQDANTTLFVGVPVQVGHSQQYYNAIVAVGNVSGHYFKQHLVPFGEYVPFERLLRGMIDFFDLPMSSFVRGAADQRPLPASNSHAAPLICYEIAYPELARRAAEKADFIVTVSDDSWFGDSFGPHQHLEIARMRALEAGRFLLRATNTGITAVIDPRGHIVSRLKQFETGVLNDTIQSLHGLTPWMFWGNGGILTILILVLFLALALKPSTTSEE